MLETPLVLIGLPTDLIENSAVAPKDLFTLDRGLPYLSRTSNIIPLSARFCFITNQHAAKRELFIRKIEVKWI